MSSGDDENKRIRSNRSNYRDVYSDRNREYGENDELIVEDNTIYEIDLDSYDALMREKKRRLT